MNIPYQNMEIEQIYTQLFSNAQTAVTVCAAEPGEGVTSMAFALAQRNLLAGHSTLLVDLNLFRPALKAVLDLQAPKPAVSSVSTTLATEQIGVTNLLHEPQLVFSTNSAVVVSGIIAPTKREHIIKLRQPGVLELCIEQWFRQYDTVIIDTSPLNRINAQNIPAERVAAACDGALLTVLAGKTSEASVNSAVTKLHNANATLLASVFNDRDNPTLKSELLREVKRLPVFLNRLSQSLNKRINNSRLLKLEV